jgi:protein-tyrosine-phosphatase
MAERLLQQALKAEGAPLNKLQVVSAGVAAWAGDPASANSVKALSKIGIQLDHHKSQPITKSLLEKACLVLGMTESHLHALDKYKKVLPPNVHLFREFMESPETFEIPDPYGQNLEAYRKCLDSMAEAIPSLLAYLKREY